MTATVDLNVQEVVFPQTCRRAAATLSNLDFPYISGSADSNFIHLQRSGKPVFRIGPTTDKYYLYSHGVSESPSASFVVLGGGCGPFDWEFGVARHPSDDNILTAFSTANIGDLSGSFLPNNELALSSAIYPDFKEDISDSVHEEVSLRGINPIDHEFTVLFSEQVEIATSGLRRWKPTSFHRPDFDEDDELV